MKFEFKKLSTIIIFLAAVGIGLYVVFDDQGEQQRDKEQLEQYLENKGIDPPSMEEFGISIGMQAIDFTLPLYGEEETMSLSQFKGEFVIVNMWASWCKPCRDEMPHFIQFHEEYIEDKVQMIGINMTVTERSEEAISMFVEDFNIPFPILMDEVGQVHEDYQVIAIPMTYIIDPDGKVVDLVRGYINYDILKGIYEKAVEGYGQG